ncbi:MULTISPECIES: NAD(P)/FAD-dependent oxidoreductase [Burkholderia cepacia complex]|uniref:FAD/NAD(P)-dependent oxidoreductase n=1 Tax=Burkholderia cepacia complex TaxID=87882 RepID=UPI00098098F9|nr:MULTISPECIES: NAD(P)/FAD-dependent oxidoreductase [Burkholderia cepacia complex]AQQ25084.1 FAD/NAD(P)-binding oxidoreductase [Burkholderia cenocepacia]MBK1822894.1 FAD-dependent oxidoreductase [Burkholderia orbicola]MBR8092234.1 FAD-dependent oxidoreductase [Burkholderia cenocepacia]ONV79669.1 FAD/NAD(P)-binding oxidoreductase [Burkholderia cenocepacia]ONW14414.1 FAD/NAD(P)-binding oxidoreductase [Burkholderia cenocepacia]
MSAALQPVIVGAGPAGVRAAEALVDAGLRPVVIDENARWGGQIYRQPPANAAFVRGKRTLYGFEAAKADAVHRTMAALLPHVDYRPNTLAWSCGAGRVDTLQDGREVTVPYSHLIVASGATDRMLPVPGWTLAGVYTLGGAQVALKAQGCAIGRRIVFAGTGPLLYLVAYQYAKAGAHVAAVLDTSPLRRQAGAAPALLRMPSIFAKGLYYHGWLRAHGVAIETGVTLERVLGDQHVTGLAWRAAGDSAQPAPPRVLDCDALGLGFGLRSETQLADLAGCRFGFDPLNRAWLPERDAAGRTSVRGLYVAGDGAGIAGADAAEASGRRAALALLDDAGIASRSPSGQPDVAALERTLARIGAFRAGLEAAFAPPAEQAARCPDDTIVCRCEEIDAGTLRRCVREGAATELNRLKALTRVGMGRCQGRMCGDAAALVLAAETGRPLADVGRLRAQPPVKPFPISAALAGDDVGAIPDEARDE